MNMAERLPDMTDVDLAVLYTNALRLSRGPGARRRDAIDLLPALEEEVRARKMRGPEARTATPATKRTR